MSERTLGAILILGCCICLITIYSIGTYQYNNVKEVRVEVGEKFLPPEDNNCILWYKDNKRIVYRVVETNTYAFICMNPDSTVYKIYKEDR